MKIRNDFVTNSSSSSYIFVAYYSEELLDFLRELIDGGFVYAPKMDSKTLKGYLTNEYGAEHATITSLDCFPYFGDKEKTGFQISLCANATECYTTDPYEALMNNFVNYKDMTDEQVEYINEKAQNIIDKAKKNGEILSCCSLGVTDDMNYHYSEKDYDKAVYDLTSQGTVKSCHNKDIVNAVFYNKISKFDKSAFEGYKHLEKVVAYENTYYWYRFKVDAKAFRNCEKLKEFPFAYVSSIGSSAFEGCKSLTEVDLSSANDIGIKAFCGCENLEKVTLTNENVIIKKGAFNGCPKLTLKVTKGSFAYKYAEENELNFEIVEE